MPELAISDTESKASEAMRTFKSLKQIRERYEDVWKLINDLVLPRRSDFDWNPTSKKANKPQRRIYDPLPVYLARNAADGLLGNTMNRGNAWFKIHAARSQVDNMRLFRKYAEDVEYVMYSMLRSGTFYDASHDSCMDALTVGHTALYREEHPDDGRQIYTARHPKEMYFGVNRWNEIDTIARKFFMEAREVVKEWREEGNLKENFIRNAKVAPYDMHAVIHLIRPREDRDITKIDKYNKKFESLYILEQDNELLSEGGYDKIPYPAIWRWRTNTGEIYARSPASDSLPDNLRLQQVAKTMLEFVQEQSNPSKAYPLEMKNKIDMRPGAMVPYTDPNRRVYRLFDGQNAYPLTKDMVDMLRSQISEAFYADVFKILAMNMGRTKTATEVEEISAERSALLTAVAERFTGEFMLPALRELYHHALTTGKLPPVPEGLRGYDLSSTIEFLGPLARNQQRAFLSAGFDASLNYYMGAAQAWPEVLDAIDPNKLGREIGYITGLSERVMRSTEEIAAAQRRRAEQQMQQQQAELEAQQASAYAQTTKAPEPGSPAEGM